MADYLVHVTIENKPGISDPEGKTILNDLVLKGTHQNVSKIIERGGSEFLDKKKVSKKTLIVNPRLC